MRQTCRQTCRQTFILQGSARLRSSQPVTCDDRPGPIRSAGSSRILNIWWCALSSDHSERHECSTLLEHDAPFLTLSVTFTRQAPERARQIAIQIITCCFRSTTILAGVSCLSFRGSDVNADIPSVCMGIKQGCRSQLQRAMVWDNGEHCCAHASWLFRWPQQLSGGVLN